LFPMPEMYWYLSKEAYPYRNQRSEGKWILVYDSSGNSVTCNYDLGRSV